MVVFPGQSVMLDMIDRLTQEIRRMNQAAEKLCKETTRRQEHFAR